MKQSNVIKGTLAVVALVAALVVGVAVHMHSVGSPTAGHSTQNTAKTATETTAKTAESITADYPGYSSVEEGVKAAGLVVTGVPLDSRERILYPEIDFTSGTPETNPQYGLTEDDIDMDALACRRPSPGCVSPKSSRATRKSATSLRSRRWAASTRAASFDARRQPRC